MYETFTIPVEVDPRYVVISGKPYEVKASFEIEINRGFFRGYDARMVNAQISTAFSLIESLEEIACDYHGMATVEENATKMLNLYSSTIGKIILSSSPFSLPRDEMVERVLKKIVELQLLVPQQQRGNLLEQITKDMKEELADRFGINPNDVIPHTYDLSSSTCLALYFRPAKEKNKIPVLPVGEAYFNPSELMTVHVGLELPPTEPSDKLPGYKLLEIAEVEGTLIPNEEEKAQIRRFL